MDGRRWAVEVIENVVIEAFAKYHLGAHKMNSEAKERETASV